MYTITKAERAMVLALISTLGGVNRTDGRLIASVEEKLRLDEVASVLKSEADISEEFDLVELESKWILDRIGKVFDGSEMQPQLVKYALSLESELKTTKDA